MEVVTALPPNFDDIDKVFHIREEKGILFCYGGKIYNPSGEHVQPQILEHEKIHSERQLCNYWKAKDGREWTDWSPFFWWQRYLEEPDFRLSEELFAHRREYEVFCKLMKNREQRRAYLAAIADRLSGPLYNNMIKPEEARKLIAAKVWPKTSV